MSFPTFRAVQGRFRLTPKGGAVNDERRIILEVVEELSAQISPHHPAPTLVSELEADLGLGSLERVELVRRLEDRLARPVDEQVVFHARQVNELLARGRSAVKLQRTELSGRPMPEVPRQARTLVDAFLYQAELQPQATALVLLEREQEVAAPSYAELLHQARRVGAGLQALGVEAGDRVALMLPTSVEFFEAFYGILWIGAVAVPLYPPVRLNQAEDFVLRQDAILQNSGARTLISLPQMAPMAELLKSRSHLERITSVKDLKGPLTAPAADPSSKDLAFIQYTSGSTGNPKGVALTHRNLLVNIWDMGRGYGLRSGDVIVSWLPLYHDMGLIGMALMSFCYGLPMVLMSPEGFLARPVDWLRAFSNYRGTVAAAPNFAYSICAHKIDEAALEGLDLSSWRCALNGAEPIAQSTLEAFAERFRPYQLKPETIFPAYGLAEATLAVSFTPLGRGPRTEWIDREELGSSGKVVEGKDPIVSCGRPLEEVQVRIVDAEGRILPEGVQGRVEIAGAAVMEAYFGEPPRSEPFLDTGDLGFLLDGELFITGRQKDLVIIGGRNLHPNDVEASVGTLKGIRAGCVAVFGVEHEGTERLVVLAESRKPNDQLRRAVADRVSRELGLACEARVLPPRTLPKTPSGKIRRRESKRRYLEDKLVPPRVSYAWMGRAGLAWMAGALGRLRVGGRALWTWGCLVVCWVELVILKSPLRTAVRRLLGRVGIKVESQGEPPSSGPVCLVANHASLLDPLILMATWTGPPLKFLVSESTARHPLMGALKGRHITVRRGSGRPALEQMTTALRDGHSLAVFPEGGIEAAPGVRGFATGAFQASQEAAVPVVPMAIVGSRRVMPQGTLVPGKGRIEAFYLDPLPVSERTFEGAVKLAQQARARIAEAAGEGTVEQRLIRRD